MKVTFKDQRGNGWRLAAALRAAGHDLVDSGGDVLLSDHDVPYGELCDAHDRVFVHPHGAGFLPTLGSDGWLVHPHTRGMFVNGTGQANLMRGNGYPFPIEAIGWSFCDRAPFRPRARPRRILVAPQHAMAADGWIDPALVSEHRRILHMLEGIHVSLDVTVRYVGSIVPLKFPAGLRARYVHGGDGSVDGAILAAEGADCVIGAAWTFPCVAIARGIPTLLFGQHGYTIGRIQARGPWALTSDIERYPLDASNAETSEDMWELICRACGDEETIEGWRARVIGQEFSPERFVSQFERAVETW